MKTFLLSLAGGLLVAGCAAAKSKVDQTTIHEVMIELASQNATHSLDQVQQALSNSKSLNGVQIRSVKKGKLSLDIALDKCLSRETMAKEMELAQFVAPMTTAIDANQKASIPFEKIEADGKWVAVGFFSYESNYDCASRIAINSYVKR